MTSTTTSFNLTRRSPPPPPLSLNFFLGDSASKQVSKSTYLSRDRPTKFLIKLKSPVPEVEPLLGVIFGIYSIKRLCFPSSLILLD